MCSGCGWVDDALTLADRVFCCRTPQRPECAVVLDHDLNAAINVVKLAGSSLERHNACGDASAGGGLRVTVKLAWLKQEPNTL